MFKKLLATLLLGVMLCVPVVAETYDTHFPQYVPIAGGAWIQVYSKDLDEFTVLVPADFIHDTFSFSGSGYNIANASSETISGMAYAKDTFKYYGSPQKVRCRFQSMGTLQLYEPYLDNNEVKYRWVNVNIENIIATSVNLMDASSLGRQNDNYRYSVSEKIGICIFVAVVALVLLKVFKKGWRS